MHVCPFLGPRCYPADPPTVPRLPGPLVGGVVGLPGLSGRGCTPNGPRSGSPRSSGQMYSPVDETNPPGQSSEGMHGSGEFWFAENVRPSGATHSATDPNLLKTGSPRIGWRSICGEQPTTKMSDDRAKADDLVRLFISCLISCWIEVLHEWCIWEVRVRWRDASLGQGYTKHHHREAAWMQCSHGGIHGYRHVAFHWFAYSTNCPRLFTETMG